MKVESKKILLVEDDPNFGIILREYLSINVYEVTLAKNGIEGFEKFKKDIYDLCLLDVMMPYKDGFTLAKEIREKNDAVPLIFLTAKTLKEDVLKGFKLGADDYISKPFDSEVLLAKIKSILSRRVVQPSIESEEIDFTIGSFDFNSKLRMLTFKDTDPIKLSPKENHVTIKKMSAGYGKMEILHDFDLFVSKAQSLCLIGPNGAGKSTILHSIYGFTNIFSGQIEIDGKDITSLTPAEKLKSCGIAYILQDNSVFPDMTVEENLLMGGYSKENTNEALSLYTHLTLPTIYSV